MKYSNYIIYPLYYLFTKSELQGAQTTLYTVLEDENKLEKGGYYSDCKPSFTSDFASNLENARRLWEISERELNIKFEVK